MQLAKGKPWSRGAKQRSSLAQVVFSLCENKKLCALSSRAKSNKNKQEQYAWFSIRLGIRCRNGEKLYIAFSTDCCDRQTFD